MKRLLCFACLVIILVTSCQQKSHEVHIIPKPQQVNVVGGSFELSDEQVIGIASESLKPAAQYLKEILEQSTGFKYTIKTGEGDITLQAIPDKSQVAGAYRLDVNASEVKIVGVDYKGVINGVMTLLQLLPSEIMAHEVVANQAWEVPQISITDAPAYEWRGMMLDVSRHFYTKAEIKEFLDLMAMYKMNKFHWHLTDDQGWRIEIKQYPLLTEVGGWREFNSHDKSCISSAKKNPDFALPKDRLQEKDGKTIYGGFYTQEDIKEIVAYASNLGIDIIPEIDMPGHCLAAISNYDGLSCFKQVGWGHTFSSPLCPGKDSALEFCKNVYEEIFALFPYEYAHLGADEVEKNNWEKCRDCQRRIKKEGLKDEKELQAWFVKEMEAYFNENGRKLIGWDEILEGGLSETATISWWRSWERNAVKEATSLGNEAILCPNSFFYFDYAQDANTIRSIYESDVIANLNDEQKKLVKGMQANIWCEWIPSRERMQYMTFPRALAVAERAWSSDTLAWDGFAERLEANIARLEVLGVNYRIPDVEGNMENAVFVDQVEINWTCSNESMIIRYTEDGTDPTVESAVYTGPFTVTASKSYKIAPFTQAGRRGDIYEAKYTKMGYKKGVEKSNLAAGLSADWYDFKGRKCEDITKAAHKKNYIVEDVKIPAGVKGRIGLVFNGYFEAPADGIYTFSLLSDDGSILKVGGDLVVDNDGEHSPKTKIGQIALAKGMHTFEVRYFDSNGGVLSLHMLDEKGEKTSAKSQLFH